MLSRSFINNQSSVPCVWCVSTWPDVSVQSGFDMSFKHLDGHEVQIKKVGITAPGDVIQMEKEGMPRRGSSGKKFGNLYIRFSVIFPKVG